MSELLTEWTRRSRLYAERKGSRAGSWNPPKVWERRKAALRQANGKALRVSDAASSSTNPSDCQAVELSA